jgi:predicted heme/steroid binding protein
MRKFTREELSRYNGKDGAPAYVGYRGIIYDVTGSFLWNEGRHQALHGAGEDLTDALDRDAPHGPEFLKTWPRVGIVHP